MRAVHIVTVFLCLSERAEKEVVQSCGACVTGAEQEVGGWGRVVAGECASVKGLGEGGEQRRAGAKGVGGGGAGGGGGGGGGEVGRGEEEEEEEKEEDSEGEGG